MNALSYNFEIYILALASMHYQSATNIAIFLLSIVPLDHFADRNTVASKANTRVS